MQEQRRLCCHCALPAQLQVQALLLMEKLLVALKDEVLVVVTGSWSQERCWAYGSALDSGWRLQIPEVRPFGNLTQCWTAQVSLKAMMI